MKQLLLLLLLCPVVGFGQVQLGTDIDGAAAGDRLGYSVAMSADGNRMAIGAPQGTGSNNAGYVRIYQFDNGSWTQVGMDIVGVGTYAQAGWSVSLSADGSRVAIGVILGSGFEGHVQIYEEDNSVWTQVGADIYGNSGTNQFGWAVSLSANGDQVAISNKYWSFTSGTDPEDEYVKVFQENGGTWSQIGIDIPGGPFNVNFTISISLSADGSRLAIGIPHSGINYRGSVRVYQYNAGVWTLVGSAITGGADDDVLGWSVSLSVDGSRIAIGAPGGSNDKGYTQIYQENNGTWTQVGANIDGTIAGMRSGRSVSLSSGGSQVAIGASSIGAGIVRIYQESSGTWTQQGLDIIGENSGDGSGRSVSLSADGSRVAVGAPFNDDAGNFAGHVRAYDLSALLPVTLTTFQAEAQAQRTHLTWQTATETNNAGFHVERSPDGRQWQALGFVEGAGTTQQEQSYTYTDTQPRPGINYYRLRQVDFDGAEDYSEVVSVFFQPPGATVSYYPNPTRDELILEGALEGVYTLRDLHGRVMRTIPGGGERAVVNVRELASGMYVLWGADGVLGKVVRE